MHHTLLIVIILFFSGFVAGFFDSVVGGSGVITLPALLWAGLAPHTALGTNKLASTCASSVSSATYLRAGRIEKRLLLVMAPATFVGALVGSWVVLGVNQRYLQVVIFVAIVVIATFTVLRRNIGATNRYPGLHVGTAVRGLTVALALGFYDGFVGPGTGSFLLFTFATVFGFDFVMAAGNGRVLNLTSNAAALLVFALRGKVAYAIGLPMGVGMLLGARIGSRMAIRRGVPFIRPLFVVVAIVLAVKMGFTVFG